jgi:3'-phosphoadenosine 5'-phosphosulfate sulfotransferase (PAPS reductase)/FAD synthetase
MAIIHVVSVSGGKDSAATLLLAIERFGAHRVRGIFCDTGNEHEAVYEYLDYLERATGVTIARLKADFSAEIARKRMFIARDVRTRRKDGRKLRWTNKAKRRALAVLQPTGNPYLDMCLWKGRFPSRMAQFCTEKLKRDLAVEYQLELMDQGHKVISWQGVRRDESQKRREALKFEAVGGGLYIYRPLVEWSAQDVFAYCARKGIAPNPLYKQGMGRVGCMPCINASKGEVREIAARFPEHIERIHAWEKLVAAASKRGFSTFMHLSTTRDYRHLNDGQIFEAANIYKIVEWSKTARGGKQLDLLADVGDIHACSSAYGLCE